jgi:uncharacterized protein YigA (DUF484 family)
VGTGFSATKWLEDATAVQSIAMISLRQQPSSSAFGLLVFGSEDADRFTATMSTRFLARIGELSSACISPWIA